MNIFYMLVVFMVLLRGVTQGGRQPGIPHPAVNSFQWFAMLNDIEGLHAFQPIVGFNPNAYDEYGWQAIHYAAALGNGEAVRCLIEAFRVNLGRAVSLRATLLPGFTPAMLAHHFGHRALAEELVNMQNLSFAAFEREYALAVERVERYARLRERYRTLLQSEFELCRLHLAAQQNMTADQEARCARIESEMQDVSGEGNSHTDYKPAWMPYAVWALLWWQSIKKDPPANDTGGSSS